MAMNYREYEKALMMGLTESEAVRIGEDAYFDDKVQRAQHAPTSTPCEICGEHEAVTGVNGYGVCSEYCYNEANSKEAK